MSGGSNGYGTEANRWVKEIEKHLETKVSIMMKAVADCRPVDKLIKEAKTAAKNAGIPAKVLNAALKERDLLHKVAKNRAALDDETSEELDLMIEALEPVKGLPLFDNAREAAEEKRERTKRKADRQKAEAADIDDLAGDPQTAANVIALKGGIKPLDS